MATVTRQPLQVHLPHKLQIAWFIILFIIIILNTGNWQSCNLWPNKIHKNEIETMKINGNEFIKIRKGQFVQELLYSKYTYYKVYTGCHAMPH